MGRKSGRLDTIAATIKDRNDIRTVHTFTTILKQIILSIEWTEKMFDLIKLSLWGNGSTAANHNIFEEML